MSGAAIAGAQSAAVAAVAAAGNATGPRRVVKARPLRRKVLTAKRDGALPCARPTEGEGDAGGALAKTKRRSRKAAAKSGAKKHEIRAARQQRKADKRFRNRMEAWSVEQQQLESKLEAARTERAAALEAAERAQLEQVHRKHAPMKQRRVKRLTERLHAIPAPRVQTREQLRGAETGPEPEPEPAPVPAPIKRLSKRAERHLADRLQYHRQHQPDQASQEVAPEPELSPPRGSPRARAVGPKPWQRHWRHSPSSA